MTEYKKIDFGRTSAEKEIEDNKDLIKNGFYDFGGNLSEIIDGNKSLILGYKGSGKSTIAQKCCLHLENSHNNFYEYILLEDFAFRKFAKIVKGKQNDSNDKYSIAWGVVLQLYILFSLDKDAALNHTNINLFQETIKTLNSAGLSTSDGIKHIIQNASKKNFSLKIPIASYGEDYDGSIKDVDFSTLNSSLFNLIKDSSTPNNHYILIDGLDEILNFKSEQVNTITNLIVESSKINKKIRKNGINLKIVIFCRTDIFDRLSAPNLNKIKQDDAIELMWYKEGGDLRLNPLIELVEKRTKASIGDKYNLFDDFFNPIKSDKDIRKHILDYTRHTPRDLVQCLTSIKDCSNSEKINQREIKTGMNQYSERYFISEIRDELSGYTNPENVDYLIKSLGRIGRSYIHINDIIKESECTGWNIDRKELIKILQVLFNCGAIGNVENLDRDHVTFKFRNRTSEFHEGKNILIHKGLRKALNLQN